MFMWICHLNGICFDMNLNALTVGRIFNRFEMLADMRELPFYGSYGRKSEALFPRSF